MTIDIETMLANGAFDHPVFAEFILDKYQDIQTIDRDGAKKIEDQVFTPEFLKSILEGDNLSLKIRALRKVPAACFSGVARELEACISDPDAPVGMGAGIKVLRAVAPDRLAETVALICDRAMAARPVTARSFAWLGFLHDLPRELQASLFDRSMVLLDENAQDFSQGGQDWVLVKSLEAGLCLEDPRSAGLALRVVRILLDAHDEDSGYHQFSFDLFRFLSPVPDAHRTDFELDFFFGLDSGTQEKLPEILDRCYRPGPDGTTFTQSLASFCSQKAPTDPVAWLAAGPEGRTEPEDFLTGIFTQIARDRELMTAVTENDLIRGTAATFACLIWQQRRCRQFPLDRVNDDDLVDYLILDTMDLPFMDQVRALVGGMDPEKRAGILIRAMDAALERWNTQGTGFYSLANIICFMGEAAEPEYLPLVVRSLGWPLEEDNERFYDKMIDGICRFGTPVFDALDPMMEKIREDRLLDVLEVTRKIPGSRAEDFLMAHFDLFMNAHRADTLEVCRMLVSRKGLERVSHKVGKDQPGIDALFAIVNTFEGNRGPEVAQALDAAKRAEAKIREQLAPVPEGRPREMMRLELTCTRCKDTSFYDCRNILVSPKGEGYVAEELTCIACHRICEFDMSSRAQYMVQTEMMRVYGGQKNEEEMPPPGAVKAMNSAFFGRTMSIKEGLTLYREKIRKEPKVPDHYIGLGNVYRSVNQETLARQQYEKAIECGPFYIEAYLSLARLDHKAGALESALEWLEKGRPFLRRPLICRGVQVPADQIMEGYRDLHFELVKKTGVKVERIRASECMSGKAAALKKIGPNEKCPCGSGKKYKKCCKRKH